MSVEGSLNLFNFTGERTLKTGEMKDKFCNLHIYFMHRHGPATADQEISRGPSFFERCFCINHAT